MWEALGIPTPVWVTIHNAWSPATLRQYMVPARKWEQYTKDIGINPVEPTPLQVLNFLQDMVDKGLGYGTINTAKSFLSAFISLEGIQLGLHPLITRFMKGVYRQATPKSKYTDTWDPIPVLHTLSGWGHTENICLERLTKRTIVLFLLATGQRLQAVHKLKRTDIIWGQNSCKITYSERLKTNDPKTKPLILRFHKREEDTLCVYTHLRTYVDNVDTQAAAPYVFSTMKDPTHRASSDTISRWVRESLEEGGVSNSYKPYSTRHAATSAAHRAKVPLPEILSSAGWTGDSSFARFYNRPLAEDNPDQYETDFLPALLQG